MHRLCVIPGDGIGPEVIDVAVTVLQAVIPDLEIQRAAGGWGSFQASGNAMPEETLDAIRQCGAGLFGAVSSPAYKVPGYRSAILTLRQELNLYANIRPARSLPRVSSRTDVDLVVVRENTEGLYVGRERTESGYAVAERYISREASERIARVALDLARARSGHLTVVHKANVLPATCGLFRDSVRQLAAVYAPEIVVDELLVDIAALHMASDPTRFDVLVTTNLFGDILSDISAHWMGGMGLAPSLNLGHGVAVAEPVHGSAPDIAGQGVANPCAAILSGALLARHFWDLPEQAAAIERAVQCALEENPSAPTLEIADSVLHHLQLTPTPGAF